MVFLKWNFVFYDHFKIVFFLCFIFRHSYIGLLLENIADITEEVCLPELFECHFHKSQKTLFPDMYCNSL